MTRRETEWRAVDGGVAAWFDAPSLSVGASLAAQVLDLAGWAAVDLRATGVGVVLDSLEHGDAVSAAARDLGLGADPSALQQLSFVLESANPLEVKDFWQRVLDYAPSGESRLDDPLRRDPPLLIAPSKEPRALRNRIHLDVVRPAAAVERLVLGGGAGPYGLCHADPEGNEADIVPGDPLSQSSGTSDWQAVFSAMACYHTGIPPQQRDLAVAAAALADAAGFPLLIDLRPGLVILDSGKDQWMADAHGLELDFNDLAEQLQSAARDLGAVAAAGLPRFVQILLDAADVASVRAFWVAALGYVEDRRAWVSDIHDPRRLGPELVFQQLDAADIDRRRQRNRIHLQLAVPAEGVPARLETIAAARGRLVAESQDWWRIVDPEGNELVLIAGEGRPSGISPAAR